MAAGCSVGPCRSGVGPVCACCDNSADTPPVVSAQIILKKKQNRPYTGASYTLKYLAICTGRGDLQYTFWLQEKKDLTKNDLATGEIFSTHHALQQVASVKAVEEYVRDQLDRGLVPAEFIGRNGKPGNAFPALPFYDAAHKEVIGKHASPTLACELACKLACKLAPPQTNQPTKTALLHTYLLRIRRF